MRILTWNINGIRAAKSPIKEVLDSLNSDIICLQETKITRNMLDTLTAQVDGYNAYFSFSRKRSGYSGVVTYCRDSCVPIRAEDGLSGQMTQTDHMITSTNDNVGCYSGYVGLCKDELVALDSEGRAVITEHTVVCDNEDPIQLCIINVYCPRVDPDREDRLEYKHNFYRILQARSETLIQSGRHVIILGDINATHKDIDHCKPSEQTDQTLRARLWIDQLMWPDGRDDTLAKHHKNKSETESDYESYNNLQGGCFLDTFRHLYPTKREAYTNWSLSTGARLTNYGRRLDYIFVDKVIGVKTLQECEILSSVDGSDHCPVVAEFSFSCVSSKKFPSFCSKYLPEVAGKQKKLLSYFTKVKDNVDESKSGLKITQNSGDACLIDGSIKYENVELLSSQESTPSSSQESLCVINKSPSKSFEFNSSQNSSQSLKRIKSTDNKISTKRVKLSSEKSTGSQKSVMSFFKKHSDSKNSRNSQITDKITNYNLDKSCDGSSKADPELKSETEISQYVKPLSTVTVDSHEHKQNSEVTKTQSAALKWKQILSGPAPPPLCKGHNQPCVLRTVKKADSYNKGRQFYVCCKPEGHASNPESRCEHFQWVK